MKLQDLLHELRINILNDRSDQTSGNSDYLWTDETLIRHINEAQRRFAVRSLIIRDGRTPEVTRVTLRSGVGEYDLHESVIAVISAQRVGQRRDLVRAGHSILNGASYYTDTWDVAQNQNPGPPVAFSTDEQIGEGDDGSTSLVTMRVWPTPSAEMNGQVLQLRVVRKPINEFTRGNLQAVPEIPVDHHIEMLDWAAYLALRIQDHDAGSMRRAADFAASFEEHVKSAKAMVMRKLFAPKPWGFGLGGWSWGA